MSDKRDLNFAIENLQKRFDIFIKIITLLESLHANSLTPCVHKNVIHKIK